MFQRMNKGNFRAYGKPIVNIIVNNKKIEDWISFMIYGTNHYVWSNSQDTYKGTILLDTTIPVKKGEEVVFIVGSSSAGDVTLQLKYDEVTI